LRPAQDLGRNALKNGIDTLTFANMHDQALAVLLSAEPCLTRQKEFTRMAVDFFSETNMPVEVVPHAVRADSGDPGQLNSKFFSATENDRRVMSLRLNDEIAQTLLGINNRMIALKNEIATNYVNHNHEIAMIQQMVGDSAEMIQCFTGINHRLASLKSESLINTSEIQKMIASTQRLVEESFEIVRRFARDSQPTVLDDLGLMPAIQSFIKAFMADTEVGVSHRTSAITEEPTGTIRDALFNIIQEALDHIGHHAKATQPDVCIQHLDGMVRIEIKENGQGVEGEENMNTMMHNGLGRWCSKRRAEAKTSTS
jgi:signal transduction histidine kinase